MTQKKEEKKEEDLLKEQCGDDAEFYAFLCHTLYVDPTTAIPKKDLATLIDEAEESAKDGDYGNALRKYQLAASKAIFEATQKPGEKGRYTGFIQDLVPRTVEAVEKVKEKAEEDGLTDRASYLEKEIGNYEFLSKRIEDVIRVASLYYQKRLQELREMEKQVAAQQESHERREKAKTIKKVKEKAEKDAEMADAGNVNR